MAGLFKQRSLAVCMAVHSHRSRWLWATVALGGVSTILLGGVWWWMRQRPEASVVPKDNLAGPERNETFEGNWFESDSASLVLSRNPGFVGPAACETCHAENYAAASQSRHFLACRPVQPQEMPAAFAFAGDVAEQAVQAKSVFQTRHAGLRFEMRRENNQFWMDTFQRAEGVPESTLPDHSSRFDLVLGSGGKFDDVFLSWRDDGWMYELPMAWLYPSQQWAASHFDPNSAGDHSRPLTVRCLECHNTWVNHVVGTANQYQREGAILGVTCESCHGPGAEHVAAHQDTSQQVDSQHIVHPGKLDREGLIEVCSQCHSNTMKRRKLAFSHRPGQPLEESFLALTTEHHEDDHVANQTKFMLRSKCFKQHESMTCITCHSPHHQPTAPLSAREACFQCHQSADCTDRDNLPAPVKDLCIDCHMPPYIKINVNFQTEEDSFVTPIRRWQHEIAIYPVARKEVLRAWYARQPEAAAQQQAEQLTDALMDHYLAEAAACREQHRLLGAIAACREAVRIDDRVEVREALQQAVADQVALEDLRVQANLMLSQRRFAEVVEVLRQVIASKPDDAVAHGRLGTALAELGDLATARQHWEQVVKHDPNDAYGLGMLAWIAMRDQRFAEAQSLYEQVLEIEPYEAKIYYHLGLLSAYQGDYQQTIISLRRALEIEPLHVGAIDAMIAALRKSGLAREAVQYATLAVELSGKQNLDSWMVLAESSAEANDFARAQAAAGKARVIALQAAPQLVDRIDRQLASYQAEAAVKRSD